MTRVFHSLRSEYALQAFQNQRLKVATLNELNDPFELFAADLSDRKVRSAFRMQKRIFAKRLGMLCFSRKWRNPLLWSHYAERHRGVALRVEIKDSIGVPVQYRRGRIRLDVEEIASSGGFSEALAEKLFATKSVDWSYEDEVRVPVALRDCVISDGLHFEPLGDELKIVAVMLGPLCELTPGEIQANLPTGTHIKVYRARMAFRTFDIVRNKDVPVELISGTD